MKPVKTAKKRLKLVKKFTKTTRVRKVNPLSELGLFLKEREELFNDKEVYRW